MTRGERNNNPLNVKQGKDKWKGSIGTDSKGHAIFPSMGWGIRAAIITLRSYYLKHGLCNVASILSRWAPASDTIGSIPGAPPNSPKEYTEFVCRHSGLGATTNLELFSPDGEINSWATLQLLLAAMAKYENHPTFSLSDKDINFALKHL